jgi:hypothetical protein
MSATAIAHGVHYAIIAVGLVGLVALLAPSLVPHTATPPAGRVGTARVVAPATGRRVLLPVAVVGSLAAAGIHAWFGPEHFEERTLFGLFFAGSALAQAAWAVWASLRPGRALLVAGVVGNLACVALWALTRTAGLPFGLLPSPEEVGAGDLACVACELVVATCAVALLATRRTTTRPEGD